MKTLSQQLMIFRAAIYFLVTAAALYGAALATITLLQDKLLFFPDRIHQPPSDFGLVNFSEDKITTEDGESLVVWRANPAPNHPTVIFLHGNGGDLRHFNALFRSFSEQGLGLIALEWRGYGASSGTPSEEGFKKDARAAYLYAMSNGVDPKNLFIVGQSLGTGIAVWLAGQYPAAGVVLDSPYSAVVDIAAARFWMFPVRLVARNPFPARDWIGQVQAPILGLAGGMDFTTPPFFAQLLFTRADPTTSTLMIYPQAGHMTLFCNDAFAAAMEFIKSKRMQ